MKEHPILFSAPMIRAILSDSKTMTRRIVKPQLNEQLLPAGTGRLYWGIDPSNLKLALIKCPYGEIGDTLWVREAYRKFRPLDDFGNMTEEDQIEYAADQPEELMLSDGDGFQVFNKDGSEKTFPFKPSIHMPRKVCRIELQITGIQVERLQDITANDAESEGIEKGMTANFLDKWRNYSNPDTHFIYNLDGTGNPQRNSFMTLWESINGEKSWDANPWVWVVVFKRIEK